MPKKSQKTSQTLSDSYLGDNVTASFDGYRFWLQIDTGNHSSRIGLEPPMLRELDQFRAIINERLQEHIALMEAANV